MDGIGAESPELDGEMFSALAMLGAMGIGGTVPLGSLLDRRPDLARRLAALDPITAAATAGGLLTVPAIQANGVRLEALVHLCVALGRGRRKPDEKLIAETFRYLGQGMCGHMEDPAEDVFVGAVRAPWGNFRVLEGLWEGGAFYLQRILDVLIRMPPGRKFDDLRSAALALLRLSDAVCDRAKLDRFMLGAEIPVDVLPTRKLSALLLRRRHLRFTAADLAALGVDSRHLEPFVFDLTGADGLLGEAVGASSLERWPLLRDGDTFHLVLPTAVSSAIRYHVILTLDRVGLREPLARAIGLCYSELFSETALLGGAAPPMLAFEPAVGGAFAEAMMQLDIGRYVHFLFFTDPLDDLEESGLAGVNPNSVMLGDEFDRRIGHARESVADEPDFRGGLTVVVGCGIGRGAATGFGGDEWPGWRVVSCSAYDLVTLSWTRDFSPVTLWRILDARDRLATLGVRLHNINGLINLVAWARELDGHLVPHADMPAGFAFPEQAGMMAINQNGQRALRHDSLTTFDERVERFIDERWLPIRRDHPSIFADDRAAPYYASEEPGESGRPMAVYRAPNRTWWADVVSPDATPPSFAYERWRLVGTWLARAAPVLDGLPGLPTRPLLWRVTFDEVNAERALPEVLSTFEQAREAIQVEVDAARGVVDLHVGEDWEIAQFHPKNLAERALVAALVHGVGLLAGAEPTATEAALLPAIVRNDDARHGHAFTVRSYRDRVRPDIDGKVITIAREDDATIRLGMGWQVRDREAGGRIEGNEACRRFLTDLVRYLEDDLIASLKRFNRAAMLGYLLRNHERAVFDRDRWKRTSAAMLGLHGQTAASVETIADHEFKLNAVFLATRILVEIAVCECPAEGGIRLGQTDLSLMMAEAALLVQVGGWSDAMHWGLMKPELTVRPLGDVHADFGFVDDILMPHGRVVSRGRIEEAAKNYADYLEEPPAEVSAEGRLDTVFAEAWAEQFGATFDDCRVLIDFIEDLGAREGKGVISFRRSALARIEIDGQVLADDVAERLVGQLTLTLRHAWRDLPAGYPDRDRQPWRYRRQLSLVRRPLLQIDDAEDPTLMIAPGMVRDTFAYMLGNLMQGGFPDYQLSPKMKAWAKQEGGARGTIFAEEVAAALADAGWRTEVEVKITKLLGRGFDRDYGDVDVLAWRDDGDRVLAIECKDVHFRKTFGEIAEQLADFRGELNAKGKGDYLRRHLDRMDLIAAHGAEVAKYLGRSGQTDVESHLLFRHPVPMEFALERLRERVTVSRFDRIGEI